MEDAEGGEAEEEEEGEGAKDEEGTKGEEGAKEADEDEDEEEGAEDGDTKVEGKSPPVGFEESPAAAAEPAAAGVHARRSRAHRRKGAHAHAVRHAEDQPHAHPDKVREVAVHCNSRGILSHSYCGASFGVHAAAVCIIMRGSCPDRDVAGVQAAASEAQSKAISRIHTAHARHQEHMSAARQSAGGAPPSGAVTASAAASAEQPAVRRRGGREKRSRHCGGHCILKQIRQQKEKGAVACFAPPCAGLSGRMGCCSAGEGFHGLPGGH